MTGNGAGCTLVLVIVFGLPASTSLGRSLSSIFCSAIPISDLPFCIPSLTFATNKSLGVNALVVFSFAPIFILVLLELFAVFCLVLCGLALADSSVHSSSCSPLPSMSNCLMPVSSSSSSSYPPSLSSELPTANPTFFDAAVNFWPEPFLSCNVRYSAGVISALLGLLFLPLNPGLIGARAPMPARFRLLPATPSLES